MTSIARRYVVLNVNDDEPHRYVIGRVLRDGGFEVTEAATGEAALALIATAKPDVVLLDVKLPDLDGFEVCRRIKADPRTAAIPVVMLSAVLTEDLHRVQGLDSGADGYLADPHPAVTIATLRALLRAREAEEARRESEAKSRALRALSTGVLRAREDEARRIAHELHNEAGQLLASVHIALDRIGRQLPPAQRPQFEVVKALLDRTEEHLRRLAHELRPTVLDDLGLGPALEMLAERVASRAGVAVTVHAALDERMPPLVETALYRIVQEALTNAIKHARPRWVTIDLRAEGDALRCTVEDDGAGFDVAEALAPAADRGLGLLGIRERVEALAGRLRIESRAGQGTQLTVVIPRHGHGTSHPAR